MEYSPFTLSKLSFSVRAMQWVRVQPQDATTNPSLVLHASKDPQYEHLVKEAIAFGQRHGDTRKEQVPALPTMPHAQRIQTHKKMDIIQFSFVRCEPYRLVTCPRVVSNSWRLYQTSDGFTGECTSIILQSHTLYTYVVHAQHAGSHRVLCRGLATLSPY